ncbi:M17 family peptidase N-terminal domain-containing protein [Oceanobacillus alkalisoli]|uniref:M17 family peptidase N-terminal domain-containing protein n=1 Tax=Oceanobacillus alkalisoli TaxID=2925113 RepID=UPI001EE3A7FE|nr:M17 family peptidase N-terminal domain-containing protein [Oceanobacillus alkalisoli]MCG5105024.1 hypothetical protein [Oceanobacillus alkalisoli]
MSMKATILFANDPLITGKSLKQFVENSSTSINKVYKGGELFVVIKKTERGTKSYENVRMTAGSIARELSKQKVEYASINENALTGAYDSLEKGLVVTAFVEGWALGSYQFLKYKSIKEAFKTNLQVDGYGKTQSYINAGQIRADTAS